MLTPESVAPEPPAANTELGEFIARLTQLVLADAAASQRQVQQVWARPVTERVAAGRAIADVRVAEVDPAG